MSSKRIWVAFHGYARVGKDTAGQALIEAFPGMERVVLGDIIKRDVDKVLREYTGISAFTNDPVKKEQIRGFLVEAGYYRYDYYLSLFQRELEGKNLVVNTRIFRLEECIWWVERGGIIIEIQRPGYGPSEPREEEELQLVRSIGLIHATVVNDGDIDTFKRRVVETVKSITRGERVVAGQ